VLLTSAWMLTACAASPVSSSVGINLPALPVRLTQTSCVPTVLPKGPLTKAQVEKLWARDRATLVKCGYSLGGLEAFYVDLSHRLTAAKTR
jgi:hypothetical protein